MQFWQTGFWAAGFWAAGFWGDDAPPDMIQRPGLTSSNWTLLNPPMRRPVENDEALLLAMNII